MNTRTKRKKPFMERDIILARINEGVAYYEIAAQFGISITELSDLAEAKTENEKLKSSIQIKNAIIALHKEGKSHEQIAALTKLDPSLVNKTLSDYFQRKANPVTVPDIKNNPDSEDVLSFTDEERDKRNQDSVAAFRRGMSVGEISEKYNISRGIVYHILKSNGISIRKARSKEMMQQIVPAIISDYQSKLPVKKIAEKHEISACTIYNILKTNGESFRKQRSTNVMLLAPEVVSDFKDKLTVIRIAEKYELSKCTIYNILKANGVSLSGKRSKKVMHLAPEVIADFQNKLPVKQIAEKYEVSLCSIYNILKTNGVSLWKWSKNEMQHFVPGIIADFQNKLAVKTIAEKHKVSTCTIYKILKANRITVGETHFKRKSSETMDNAIADFKAGLSVAETAEKNTISRGLVYKLLKLHNIALTKENHLLPGKKVYKRTREKAALKFLKIKELFENGINLEEIADAMKMKPASIRNILRKNGIIESRSDIYIKMADEIETLFRQGLTRQQIAGRFNKKVDSVTSTLRKRGFSFINEHSEKIIGAFQSGKTIDEVAAEFRLTRGHIKNTLRKAGVSYLTRNNENKEEIARLYKENIKIYEIARLLNVNPGSVIANLIKQELVPVIGSHVLKRKLLLEEYQNGNTDFQKLSISYNIRLAEVQRICTGKTTSRNELKERTQLILQLHRQRKTVTEIKQKTGLPKSKIWRTLSKNGIHSNDFEIRFKENCKKIFPLLRQQKSVAEISILLHVGQRTVRKAMKSYFDKETDQ